MEPTNFKFATTEDVKRLGKSTSKGDFKYNAVPNEETPFGNFADLQKRFGFDSHYYMRVAHATEHRIGAFYHNQWKANTGYEQTKTTAFKNLARDPVFLLINRSDNTKRFKANDELQKLVDSAKNPCFLGNSTNVYWYSDRYWYHNSENLANANVCVTASVDGQDVCVVMPFEFAEKVFGLKLTDDMKIRLGNGAEGDFTDYESLLHNVKTYRHHDYRNQIHAFDFTFDTLSVLSNTIGFRKHSNVRAFLKSLVARKWHVTELPTDGIKKTYARLEPILEEVMAEDPLAFCFFRTLVAYCTKSVDGVKVSAIFNEIFGKVEDKKQLITATKDFFQAEDDYDKDFSYNIESAVKAMPSYKEKRKAILKSQGNRAITKLMEEAEFLTIDKKKHKRTWEKIESSELPIGTFFRKSESYFLLNDNWDLWEEMFKRGYGEQAIALANEVKGRSTYEKDLMSYLYFVLYGLPEYLKKHAGGKWTCIPKLVTSSEELEPPKEGDDGISRSRSALTPIVDNDKRTVEVPYASLAIYGGRGTTYCYSHDYHVLTRGFSFRGYAVTKDIEEKLNGRDDYGLMFYTLTGSEQGRGYPTFLIIFERREKFEDTRVHFHRTHPSRSKDGDYNPIHNWTTVCYNWVAGNIRRDRIKAQQGDLFFVQVKTDDSQTDLEGSVVKGLEFKHKVNKYDNHCFETPVDFAEYTKAAKSNILGYVQLPKPTWLNHHEHNNVLIPEGTYAIHQCRSWEANPKGVWSLRID